MIGRSSTSKTLSITTEGGERAESGVKIVERQAVVKLMRLHGRTNALHVPIRDAAMTPSCIMRFILVKAIANANM